MKNLLQWSKNQEWWPHVRALIESGLFARVHVPELPPGAERKLFHRPSGGCVEIEKCAADYWHITLAVHPKDLMRAAQSQKNPFRPPGQQHGWMHPVTIDE